MDSYGLFILLILLSSNAVFTHTQCGLYGSARCQFVPAPPNHTPSCARPGHTYCEHVEHYPVHLIKHLVHKWGYDAKNLIIDETTENFNSIFFARHNSISELYELASVFGKPSANHLGQFEGYQYQSPNPKNLDNTFPEPIYIPSPKKTEYPTFGSFAENTGDHSNYNFKPDTFHYNANWLKKHTRDLSRKKRFAANSTEIVDSQQTFLNFLEMQNHKRVKRQTSGRPVLCETTSQFITPQAALSSKGNWMYVVNEMNTARQLVKTEICASNICSNLCQLPNGYNSRCEQKYVQKRLIALNANGQNLYADTFWFPSCCVCTISN